MKNQVLKKIRKLRIENEVKPMTVANHLGIDESAYSKMENGRSNTWAKYLTAILEFYKMSIPEFFKDFDGDIAKEQEKVLVKASDGAEIEELSEVVIERSLVQSDLETRIEKLEYIIDRYILNGINGGGIPNKENDEMSSTL